MRNPLYWWEIWKVAEARCSSKKCWMRGMLGLKLWLRFLFVNNRVVELMVAPRPAGQDEI